MLSAVKADGSRRMGSTPPERCDDLPGVWDRRDHPLQLVEDLASAGAGGHPEGCEG